MAGECHYHMGQFPEALTEYNNALTALRVAPRLDAARSISPGHCTGRASGSRALVPWGMSQRTSGVGQFPQTFLISQGNVNNLQAVVQGGVVQQPVMVSISAAEIVRCTTLAIRRRHELMGPVCKYDAADQSVDHAVASVVPLRRTTGRRPGSICPWGRRRPRPETSAAAAATLERAVVVHGELDHPLTADALFGLGRLALESGDYAKAGRLFEETTYATATYAGTTFADPALVEEAFRYGQLTHLLTNQKDVYPPLVPALTWSRSHGSQQLHASLAILLADNLAALGETSAAVTALGEARGVLVRSGMGACRHRCSDEHGRRIDQLPGKTSVGRRPGVECGLEVSADRLAVDVSDRPGRQPLFERRNLRPRGRAVVRAGAARSDADRLGHQSAGSVVGAVASAPGVVRTLVRRHAQTAKRSRSWRWKSPTGHGATGT